MGTSLFLVGVKPGESPIEICDFRKNYALIRWLETKLKDRKAEPSREDEDYSDCYPKFIITVNDIEDLHESISYGELFKEYCSLPHADQLRRRDLIRLDLARYLMLAWKYEMRFYVSY